ncbi:MAG: hypothetical protein P8N07_05175 [Flavobacteriales bacterium]|nr:hypothetical protein [Flavobacteriales bacterium]|tara:strand:- start:2360 stop:2743 length:384 start_codon:yes stop_codon:yes gene_type:complete
MKTLKLSLVAILIITIASCSLFKSKAVKQAESKMNFEFSKLDKNGLIKKRGTSLAYEFCIPNNETYLDKIKEIDESISIYKSGSGRIGCSNNEILCIGETHNKDYKRILTQIAELEYVKSINESFFE